MLNTNYIVIQGWMCNELKLKGNELLVYALIYGFSQDEESVFRGSRNYIADTFNISLPTVDKALKGLLDKELIVKNCVYSINDSNMETNVYKVSLPVKKLYTPSKETLQGDNIIKNINNNINNNTFLGSLKKDKTVKTDNLYVKCVNLINGYTEDSNIRSLLIKYLNLRLEMREKPLYVNQWKGLLSKLDNLSKSQNQDIVQVINQSIEKGYASFFPVNSYVRNNSSKFSEGDGLHSISCTKEELIDMNNSARKREENGIRGYF